VLLIAIGLDILFGRRSAIGSLIALMLIIALIAGAVWLAVTVTPSVIGQTLTTERITQELGSAASADVQISFGAGRLRLGALKDSSNLIEGTFTIGSGEKVRRDYRMDGSVARLQLHSEGVPFSLWPGRHSHRAWELNLSSSVPMELKISTGVGESLIDLSGLRVTDLKISTGIGQTDIKLPAHGRVRAKISGGIGQVIITIPESMAARIRASAGLGSLSMSSRFSLREGDYVSSDYAAADDLVDLDISGGIGQIVVR